MRHVSSADEHWMRRALELAERGKGRVEPNPLVGAVIVKDGKFLAEGFHERFGGLHAEAIVLEAAGTACVGATLYVTLSPCTGMNKKTPPCCDAVIQAKICRIVIGAHDPTQESPVSRLEAAGIKVQCGVLEEECRRLIAPFLTLRLKKRPYIIAKWAMTADGKIATLSGDSKWISSEASRKLVHRWRNEVDAVLVGSGTVRRDDPLLTCRLPGGRNPRRIILDANAALKVESRLIQSITEAPVIVACVDSAMEENHVQLERVGCTVWTFAGKNEQMDVEALLRRLGEEQLTNLMIEGGATTFSTFFERSLVDEVRIFIAPKLVGGATAPSPIGGTGLPRMAHAIRLQNARWTIVDGDMLLTGMLAAAEPA